MLLFYLLRDAGAWVWAWLWDTVQSLTSGLMESISGMVPEFAFDVAFLAADILGLVDEWFPVGYAFLLVGLYVGLAVFVYGINWVLGLIPTIS